MIFQITGHDIKKQLLKQYYDIQLILTMDHFIHMNHKATNKTPKNEATVTTKSAPL